MVPRVPCYHLPALHRWLAAKGRCATEPPVDDRLSAYLRHAGGRYAAGA